MLKFWYRCILLLSLIRGMLPAIELNVPVGSEVELLSSIEADKHNTVSLYANHYNKGNTLIAEWKLKVRTYVKDQYYKEKIFKNDTGIFMRVVDQADAGRYSFKYNVTIDGITVMLNVSESTHEKQIPKCLLDEEYIKIVKGLQGTNPFTIIANIVVMIASSVYILVHIKSCCRGQYRENPGSMPRDLTLGPVEGDTSSVTLTWQAPQNPNGQITEYLVFYTNDSSNDDRKWFVEKVLGDKLSKTIRDLTRDTTYCFKVQARYKMEYGPKSYTAHYRIPKEENVPLLAITSEQAAVSTVVDMHEENVPLLAITSEQAAVSTVVDMHEENVPLLAITSEQAAVSTVVDMHEENVPLLAITSEQAAVSTVVDMHEENVPLLAITSEQAAVSTVVDMHEENVPLLAITSEQAAVSTVVDMHEETVPLLSTEQAEDNTAVKLHEETVPLLSTEQAEDNTAVKLHEETVPLLSAEQAEDNTAVKLHEETVPLLSTEQAEDNTAVKLHDENFPLSSTEQAEHSTSVKLHVQSHIPSPLRQDTGSTPSKLSGKIRPLSPRDDITDPTPTTAEILTEEQVSQYLDSHREFLVKYLDGKLKSANMMRSF